MKALALLSLLMLSGCGSLVEAVTGRNYAWHPTDYESVRADITSQYDQYQHKTTFKGPWVNAGNYVEYFLRAWADEGRSIQSSQLYISITFRDWAFLDRGFSDGQPLSVTQIDRSVGSCSSSGGCNVVEDVGVNLSEADIRKYSVTGFALEVAGRGNKADLHVPAAYIRAFCDKVFGQCSGE